MPTAHDLCRASMTGMHDTARELKVNVPSFFCERAANGEDWFYFYDRNDPAKTLWETDGCCKWDARAQFIDYLIKENDTR